MTTHVDLELTTSELAAAMGAAGVSAPDGLPSEGVIAGLRTKGVLGPDGGATRLWRETAEALAQPAAQVHLVLGNEDQWFSTTYSRRDSHIVSHAERGDTHYLSSSCTVKDIAATGSAWLGREAGVVEALGADLDRQSLVAIAALADARHEALLQAQIERRPAQALSFTIAQLTRQLTADPEADDPRWLTSLLSAYAPDGFRPEPADLPFGLAHLEARGWIRRDEALVVLEDAALEAVEGIAPTCPYLVLAAGPSDGPRTELMAWQGKYGDWCLRFGEPDPERARLYRVDGSLLEGLIEARAASVLGVAADREEIAARPDRCPACHTEFEEEDRFCTVCQEPRPGTVAAAPSMPPAMASPPSAVTHPTPRAWWWAIVTASVAAAIAVPQIDRDLVAVVLVGIVPGAALILALWQPVWWPYPAGAAAVLAAVAIVNGIEVGEIRDRDLPVTTLIGAAIIAIAGVASWYRWTRRQ